MQELAKPYRSDSGLRQTEKRLKDVEKIKGMSDRAKRINLCDHLDTLINGQPMTPDQLADYLAESETVIDTCRGSGPTSGGLAPHEIGKHRNPERKEVDMDIFRRSAPS